MAVPAYSIALFGETPLSAPIVTFGPPPDGFIWVVRDIVAVNRQAVPIITSGIEMVLSTTAPLMLIPQTEARAGGFWHWRGRQVFEPGVTCDIDCPDFNAWGVSIAGYVLKIA
jgi:hypothetical protein